MLDVFWVWVRVHWVCVSSDRQTLSLARKGLVCVRASQSRLPLYWQLHFVFCVPPGTRRGPKLIVKMYLPFRYRVSVPAGCWIRNKETDQSKGNSHSVVFLRFIFKSLASLCSLCRRRREVLTFLSSSTSITYFAKPALSRNTRSSYSYRPYLLPTTRPKPRWIST